MIPKDLQCPYCNELLQYYGDSSFFYWCDNKLSHGRLGFTFYQKNPTNIELYSFTIRPSGISASMRSSYVVITDFFSHRLANDTTIVLVSANGNTTTLPQKWLTLHPNQIQEKVQQLKLFL